MALLPTQPDPPTGSASGYAVGMVNNLAQLRLNDQTIEDRLEYTFTSLLGTGVIDGTFTSPVLTAGTGLQVNVGAMIALIGFCLVPAAGVVTVPASSSLYIFLYQDGTFATNTTGTNPGTTDNPAIVLGTATTSGSAVTAVADTFRVITLFGSGFLPTRERFTTKTGGGAFDAAADRTGAACTVTLGATPRGGAVVTVRVGRACWVEVDDYTISGTVVTFVDGAKPIAGEVVRVDYYT